MARRQVALPYSPGELALLISDARVQPTAAKRRAAQALIALGAGAGLDGRWAAHVRATDVVEEGGVLLVQVGEPSARVVPALAAFEREIAELASSADGEFLVGGNSTSDKRASRLASALVASPGHQRLSAARLRSTWLLTHLIAGTRLPELAQVAGLRGVTVLSDLLAHVERLPEAEIRRHLRDPGSK